MLEKTALGDVRSRLIGNLSKGFRQRVGLAQALIHNPQVLILDEPTVGLDPKQIIEIRELIKGLAGDHTVILSSHILPEVTATCQRIIVINQGQIVAEDTLDRLTHAPEKGPHLLADGEKPVVCTASTAIKAHPGRDRRHRRRTEARRRDRARHARGSRPDRRDRRTRRAWACSSSAPNA